MSDKENISGLWHNGRAVLKINGIAQETLPVRYRVRMSGGKCGALSIDIDRTLNFTRSLNSGDASISFLSDDDSEVGAFHHGPLVVGDMLSFCPSGDK